MALLSPDREVARLPVPPDCVFRHGDSVLEESIQQPRFAVIHAEEPLHEAAEKQGVFPGFGVYAHHGMLRLELAD